MHVTLKVDRLQEQLLQLLPVLPYVVGGCRPQLLLAHRPCWQQQRLLLLQGLWGARELCFPCCLIGGMPGSNRSQSLILESQKQLWQQLQLHRQRQQLLLPVLLLAGRLLLCPQHRCCCCCLVCLPSI
jgi:hypothetical protein